MGHGRRVTVALLVVVGAAPVPAEVPAATLSVDFESGPAIGTPIEDEYLASAFTFWQRSDPGFRPYRRVAGVPTHSGLVAADIGPSHCYPGEEDDPVACEFPVPGTEARLTHTARAVTVYAGLFSASNGPVSATLTAYRADNSLAGSTTVPIGVGLTTKVTVMSAVADIARFDLVAEGPGSVGAELGFDDLTLTFPAQSIPDMSVSVPPDTVPVLQGGAKTVPARVTRLNGSSGPVTFSVTGLPAGVTGTVSPDPLPGVQTNATLRLAAADNATTTPLKTARLIANPQGNANVAPAPRSTQFTLRVASAFTLSPDGTEPIHLPQCAPVDRTFVLERDRSFGGTVQLSVDNAPAGVTAQILPSATVPPGGGFNVERTLRVTRGAADVGIGRDVTVRAHAPGYPDRTYTFPVDDVAPQAVATPGFARTPRRGLPGTTVRLDGNGFCPGTTVQVGEGPYGANFVAEADTTIAPDNRSLTFSVPRPATTGRVTVVPPDGAARYRTSNAITVRSFRGEAGFAFPNYHFSGLSLTELTETVGADDLFIQVNPCWPWGTCYVPTGILDPIAALEWPIFSAVLVSGDGHCYGMNRAIQELLAGRVSYNRFAFGVTSPFDLPSASGPQNGLGSYLDSRQAIQLTAEALRARLERDPSLDAQLARMQDEFDHGRYPGITLRHGAVGGHEVTAFDYVHHDDGSSEIYTYDPNRPLTQAELDANPGSGRHLTAETDGPAIRINAARDHWDYTFRAPGNDSGGVTFEGGGDDGSLYTVPLGDIPANPTLPGLSDLDLIVDIFGSVGGAAVTDGQSKGAQTEPLQDAGTGPGKAGIVLARSGAAGLMHAMRGVHRGRYSELIAGPDFVGGVSNVATSKGVRDRLKAKPNRGALTFLGGRDRPLDLALATNHGRVQRAATVHTDASRGGRDKVAIHDGDSLTYKHKGASARASFSLTSVSRRRGPVSFRSRGVKVHRRERLTLMPAKWRSLDRVKMVSRRPGHQTMTRVLRNRAKFAARLSVRRPRLKGRRAKVGVRIRRVPAQAAGGVVLRLRHHGRTVARKARAIEDPERGRHTYRWKVPHVRSGSYRLVANVTLAGGTRTPGSRTVKRTARVRVR